MSEETVALKSKRTSARKVRTGVVRSDKMDKTITVDFSSRKKHPLYKKMLPFTKRLTAHDENNDAKIGDLVELMETKPLSKTKRWRLVKVLERAK